jgi:hypothetical protein
VKHGSHNCAHVLKQDQNDCNCILSSTFLRIDLEYEYQKGRNKEYHSTSAKGPFHTRFRALVELIFEDPTVTVK